MIDLKLWYSPGACSLAPHILLQEIGANFEGIQINVMKGFPEEYKYLNPKGRVPIFSLDGEIITEVPAIATAISQLAPKKHLMGKTNLETVRVYEWMNWLSGTVHGQCFGAILRPRRYTDDESIIDIIVAKGKKNLEAAFDDIEGKMTGGWAVGDQFTVVDAFLYVLFRWAANPARLAYDMKNKYPKFTALAAKVASKDSVKKALQEEGQESMIPANL